jgi:ketosteroid isomerase-like protein
MSQANVAAAQSLYAAFGRGDIATILAGVAPDIDWRCVGRPSDFPTFGPRKGPKEVGEFFKAVADTNDFSEFSPKEFYADGDKVFVLGHYALSLKKNGKKIASDWCHIFTFHDGKLVKFREFLDTAQAAEAFRG